MISFQHIIQGFFFMSETLIMTKNIFAFMRGKPSKMQMHEMRDILFILNISDTRCTLNIWHIS